MDLHDEPVVEAHRRHFRQHLRAEEFGVGVGDFAGRNTSEQRGRFARREVGGRGAGVAVIARCRAMGLEEAAALTMGGEVAGPGSGAESRGCLDYSRGQASV